MSISVKQGISLMRMSILYRISTDIVPKIYMSVNTPRDAAGLVSGKPKRCFRTRYSAWVTEKTFVKQYQKIREKF